MRLKGIVAVSILIITFIWGITIFPIWSRASSYFRQELKVECGEVHISLNDGQEVYSSEAAEER